MLEFGGVSTVLTCLEFITMQRLVIVEDEPDIVEILAYNLEREGYEVESATDGLAGLELIKKKLPDLVLLDLMLPGCDGLEICRQMKEGRSTRSIPVIMVTAKGDESDIIVGLGVGADDYVSKPFSPKEIVARVKAVLRRVADPVESATCITQGPLKVFPEEYGLEVNGKPVSLTLTEFRILLALCEQPNRVFDREQLLKKAVGENVVVVDRNVDVHIRNIRKALGEYKNMIETVRGVGYRLAADKL